MKSFKDWLKLNEVRFKGLHRQFVNSHPEIPKYVGNQIYQNRIVPDFSKALKSHSASINANPYSPSYSNEDPNLAPTVAYQANTPENTPRPSPAGMLSGNQYLNDIVWPPRPIVTNVSPLDFDQATLSIFINWRFGFSPKNHAVRNDSQRFDVQRQLLKAQQEGDNEPVIAIKEGDKYKLFEGFHRTMMLLLSPDDNTKGAPEDQIELLRQKGSLENLDFSRWTPVPIKMYVGSKKPTSPKSPFSPTSSTRTVAAMEES
jgi:hypothetical protein